LLIYIGTQYKGASCKRMGSMTGMSNQAASKAKERGELVWNTIADRHKLIS
jgi:hypothetical protein